MKKTFDFTILMRCSILALFVFFSTPCWAQSPYFTGDGGKGIRLAVLEPTGKGLSAQEQWMLSLIQGSITGDFNKYSAITVIDRQNIEKILAEQTHLQSGNYTDSDYISLGKLTNSRYILAGVVSKTANNYMLELSVSDAENGERKASYPPKPVSLLALENLSAIKEASSDLLGQMGVKLTEQGLRELKSVTNTAQIQGETALARGIAAQRQGTEVAALSYFFQAATFDPSLAEAINRSSILAANISSGNIGADARNDIAWRRDWIARLTETEQYFANFNQTESMPYTLFYVSGEIKQEGEINYRNETVTMRIETHLHGSGIWTFSTEQVLQAVYDGLNATGRKNTWELGSWPQRGVTNLNAFARRNQNFSVVFELMNSQNKVIGRQTLQSGGSWGLGGGRPTVNVSADDRKTLYFQNVNVNDITDSLTIQVATVNGTAAETAARNGILQIRAVTRKEFDANTIFKFERGEIQGFANNNNRVANLVIPATIWGDPVISIRSEAFKSTNLTSVTIPDSVISIGDSAFRDNPLTSVKIGKGIKSIGSYVFMNNSLTSLTIPDNVTSIGDSAFFNSSLTEISLGNNVMTIGNNAFSLSKLRSITIPDSIKSIGTGAFRRNLTDDEWLRALGLYNITIRSNISFKDNPFLCYFYVEEERKWRPVHDDRSGFLYLYNRNNKTEGNYYKNFGEPWKYITLQQKKAIDLETLGADAYKRKDFAKAKAYLEEALQFNPKLESAKALLKKANNELNKQNKNSAKK